MRLRIREEGSFLKVEDYTGMQDTAEDGATSCSACTFLPYSLILIRSAGDDRITRRYVLTLCCDGLHTVAKGPGPGAYGTNDTR